jgi:hypothetical protein
MTYPGQVKVTVIRDRERLILQNNWVRITI